MCEEFLIDDPLLLVRFFDVDVTLIPELWLRRCIQDINKVSSKIEIYSKNYLYVKK